MQEVMSTRLSRFLLFALAAAWFSSSICYGRSSYSYCVLPFYTRNATGKTYSEFIQILRYEMGSQATIYGIPMLREAASWTKADRFIQVTLYNSAGTTITFAVDKVAVDLVGYRTGYEAYFFPDKNGPETSNLFPGTKRYVLPFNFTYASMEKSVGCARKNINLGMGELDKAIQALYDKSTSALASSFLVCIQMISVAVRYRYVEKLVMQHITYVSTSVFLPTAAMIAFEDNSYSLDTKISNSVGGVLYPPFMFPDASNQEVPITSVFLTLGLDIGCIAFICRPATSIPPFPSPTCQDIPEPTVLIRGRNGYCVDVELNSFKDKGSIILYPCKSLDKAVNQLWTLKKDGTIRSKGKCLNANSLTAGQNVNIHNCSIETVADTIKWKINDNGNIESLKSGLVLSGFNGKIYSKLTVEKNTYAASQCWRLSNSTKPVVTPITGYESMCMQQCAGNTVRMVSCGNTNVQKWQLYPDGTVRPNNSTASCLTSKSSQDGKTLVINSCNGGEAERWLFNNDGSISDASNKYVLEVNKLKNIVVVEHSAYTPTEEQTWSVSTL